jgi:hypothetical protein
MSSRESNPSSHLLLEAREYGEVIRKRMVETFKKMRQAVAYCLRAPVKSGDLSRKNDGVSSVVS